MERPPKRQRTTSLPTPPTTTAADEPLPFATHILQTQTTALQNLTNLYTHSPTAGTALQKTLTAITTSHRNGGRLHVTALGKSAHIAQKLVATLKSLSLSASFLHAADALHGDLGDLREEDVLMMVSASGRTPELMALVPFVPRGVDVVVLTTAQECELLARLAEVRGGEGGGGILLPAPVVETEEVSFGVGAPTTSTTVALAVADMVALCVAREVYGGRVGEVFGRNHPGGAIGMDLREGKGLVELPSPSVSGAEG